MNAPHSSAQPPPTNQGPSGALDIQFVEPGHDIAKSRAGRVPKAAHKKSRNGCQMCRARRVKCDEVRPICGNCRRYQHVCTFPQSSSASCDTQSWTLQQPPTVSGDEIAQRQPLTQTQPQAIPSVGDSSARRLLELRLMHAYSTRTSQSIVFDGDPVASEAMIHRAPVLAFTNNALLYALLSFTAIHLAENDPAASAEMLSTYHTYWHMTLQEHKQDLAKLNLDNFDAICTTSIFIRLNAFVILKARPLEPYTPPTEWYRITQGAMQVFVAARQSWTQEHSAYEFSVTSRLTNRMPFVWDESAKFGVANRRDFLYLLDQVGQDNKVTAGSHISPEDQDVFEKAVSYIGGTWITLMGAGGDVSIVAEVARRMVLLPHLLPPRFAELVEQQCPRALVILAHYFAILSRFHQVWWIGATGEREIRALATTLPPAWQPLMKWPLDMVNGEKEHERS